MRLLDLPDAMRDAGLEPVLVDGWQTRGGELSVVRASLDHHTAGAPAGYVPSLKTLIYGRPDLPGPLCNGAAPRSEPGDFKVYVIAAGRANHAGAGLWNGADSNTECAGLERELVGDGSDVTAHRNEVSVRWHTAVCRVAGLDAAAVCRHAEYALPKGRKPDTAGVSGDWLRGQVAARLQPAPDLEDDMSAPVRTTKCVDSTGRTWVIGCTPANTVRASVDGAPGFFIHAGVIVGELDAVAGDDGVVEVFGRGPDMKLYACRYDGSGFGAWREV